MPAAASRSKNAHADFLQSRTSPPFLPSAIVRAFCAFSRPDCHIGHGAAPQLAGILLLNTPYLIVFLATYWSHLFYCHTICGVSFLCHPVLYSLKVIFHSLLVFLELRHIVVVLLNCYSRAKSYVVSCNSSHLLNLAFLLRYCLVGLI